MTPPVTLYLIHAEQPYRHAGHYLGITRHESVLPRLERHLRGEGNKLVKLFAELAGCTTPEELFRLVVATWPGTRGEERRLKNRGGLSRICPVCRAARGLQPYKKREAH